MTLLYPLKIRHKLLLVTGMLVVGFGGVGTAYRRLSAVHDTVAARTTVLHTFAAATEVASTKTLESELLLRDFLNRGQADMVVPLQATLTAAVSAANALVPLAVTDPIRVSSVQLTEAVEAYQRAAESTMTVLAAIGFEESSGLRGEAQSAAVAIDQAFDTLGDPTSATGRDTAGLLLLWRAVRQHQQAFVASGKESQAGDLAIAKRALSDAIQSVAYPAETKAQLTQMVETYYRAFLRLAERIKQRQRAVVQLQQRQRFATPLVAAIGAATAQELNANHQHGQAQIAQVHQVFGIVLAVSALLVIAALGGVGLGMTRTVRRLHHTVTQFSAGEVTARTGMRAGDELATLGQAFDTLLDERVGYEQERAKRLAEAEHENQVLNTSIIDLLYAVAQLSQRDLTVHVPVTNDLTGPIADALNQLAEDTAEVMLTVTQISDQVALASQQVQRQAETVRALADTEQVQVTDSATRLATAATAMHQIAALAQICDIEATQATARTQQALDTVTNTAQGINTVQRAMQETEQRLKRLGERSQDISQAVRLVSGIAERTHILALNANMHAVAAGEAGRGFAVVAEEVQRLAESTRESTEQIARLVRNVQSETIDTIAVMNAMISEVSDGQRLARDASTQMQSTQQSTAALVASVHQIAAAAQEQAQVSTWLRDQAHGIVASAQKTSTELSAQSTQTARLLDYARTLVEAVHVFKLPPPVPRGAPDAEQDEDVLAGTLVTALPMEVA